MPQLDFEGAGFNYDAASARKALNGTILLRDADGVNTALDFVEEDGQWVSGFNPFDPVTGGLRTDLIVEKGGTWFNGGGGESAGPTFANKLDVKKEHFWQTRQVIRTDVTSEEGTFKFGLAEHSTLSDTLEFDLPLLSTPAKGTPNYARKKPNEFEGRLRQALVFTYDKGGFLTCDVLPAISAENIDDRQLSAENLIATILTWGLAIDPHSGYSLARFRSGPGWESNPGPPQFSATPPLATPGAAGAVTIAFDEPKGPAGPFTYTVRKTLKSTGVESDLTLGGSPSVSGGVVTLSGSGLASASQYDFAVHAANAVGKKSISPTSNVITASS